MMTDWVEAMKLQNPQVITVRDCNFAYTHIDSGYRGDGSSFALVWRGNGEDSSVYMVNERTRTKRAG